MSDVAYAFQPGDQAWQVNTTNGVNQCVVVKVLINIQVPAVQTVQYNIQYCNPNIQSATVNENTMFADLDSALFYYASIIPRCQG